ncbi:MAG: Coenzyme F420 hydrogenase/dehydrogenase, beta subunit C-terminal domain [Ruminococcus sp.]|uniref:Coenzyme F420 hydrogenase/dehydrogenase, beta subunit C-terminal domain n=1 Tax=Ruminococcus sp. TaxID=41978 RepID=UPI0025F7B62D|nr:Coenzyme F420 hydrogenase/dehydrogenase, beta subunit C-terminal domain [Ruminococcus sp.]MCR5600626.1 Coenzyme F420 hydrogenase/dehydrogenase, beta subunit C-terminal domain [Ruminococcus sp.]
MIELKNKSDCCGCTACYSICPKNAITLKSDSEGFLYPTIAKKSCVECGLCEKVCPIINKKTIEAKVKRAFLVQNTDEKILRESTSGGAFSAIARYVLKHGGIVFGAAFDDKFRVIHTCAEKEADLSVFRNSKYVQSNPLATYSETKQLLKSGRMVCYSGTPCQIEGLKQFLGKEYDNLITVDVVCRAVPSPGVWNSYMKLVSEHNPVSSVHFRDKAFGYQYSTMEIKSKNGNTNRSGIEQNQWLRLFFSGLIIRPSCTKCKFRSPDRVSDFTIWDCFNAHKFRTKLNEKKGITRVLIHTPKAKAIIDALHDDLIIEEIPYAIAIDGVKEMKESPKMHEKHKKFYEDYNTLTFGDLLQKYVPITVKVRAKTIARRGLNFMGLDVLIKRAMRKG